MIQADFKCIPFLRCVGRLNRRVLVLITLGLWGKKKSLGVNAKRSCVNELFLEAGV